MDDAIDCPLAAVLADRLREARDDLTRRWLDRIVARVAIDPDHVFPTHELLDHVPLLVDGIADYLEDPADEISADVPVIAKAMELGEMRQAQGFSAYEILKEYEILGGVLFAFLVRTVDSVEEECSRSELLACGQRLFRAVSVIQRVTTMQYLRISDEKVKEREEKLRSFNRMVTHELKNRMSAVRGASSMLGESWVSDDPAQRRRFLTMIQENTAEMEKTLGDLLSLSRTDHDNRQQRNVQLPEAVAEAVRQLRDMAAEWDVAMRVAEGLPEVEVDAAAVELCLVNLISNGIKFSDPEKGERWVEVRAHRQDVPEAQGEVVIEVSDNGTGVPESARDHLFERFYRAGSASDIAGTGLGLSIVRDTVEAVGGRAWADFDADDGGGATFKIALPARRDADASAAGDDRSG
ncbi:MAG TPA: sensor histidine kinase [Longimicrobiales bacterium]|nr:sensor histidine kinase [Longimicrobiales bacterium]